MAIQIDCTCGKKFAAPDKFRGKKVKCPSCQTPQVVPGKATAQDDDLSDLLDEVGYDQEKTKESCPECGTILPPEAVLCVTCGFHQETGKFLKTKSYTELAQKRRDRTRIK